MNGVDLTRFEFDYDTTWNSFFVDAELNVYSRYGGRDAGSADGRHSKASLLQTMREVLEVHDQRKAGGQADLLQPVPGPPTTPEDIPLLAKAHEGCVHCHQVQEYRLLQAYYDRTFQKRQLFGYPLPENIGLRFDLEHGHRVKEVIADSAAARAGLSPLDVVTRVNDVPIHSEEDFRWVLHRADDARPLVIRVLRPAGKGKDPPQSLEFRIRLSGGWRQSDLSWRKSLRSVPLPLGFLGYTLGREERTNAGLSAERMALRVVSIRGQGLAQGVGLKKGDTIVSLGGRNADRTFEQFKSDLLQKYSPGDLVKMEVLRDGQRLELEGPFPDWHTTDTSIP